MGNQRSIYNGFKAVGADPFIASTPSELKGAEAIVLPGVGAFGVGMQHLNEMGWREVMEKEVLEEKTPFLGICLGMQLLASHSMEHGKHEGLNWIHGSVKRMKLLQPSERLPHMGWNDVKIPEGSRLFDGMGGEGCFYFVHSFAFNLNDSSVLTSTCEHGESFTASVEIGNIMATQFHPEKSHHSGLAVDRKSVV